MMIECQQVDDDDVANILFNYHFENIDDDDPRCPAGARALLAWGALDSKLSGAAESYSGSTSETSGSLVGLAESYYNSRSTSGALEGLSDRRKH